MAVSNRVPAPGDTLTYAQSFTFEVTSGYTSLLVRCTVEGGGLESVYDSGSGGAAAGYSVTVTDLGATIKFECSRDAGWSIDPTTIYVTEDVTTTTSWTYDVFPTAEYPEGMQPYNALGSSGTGVTSFKGRQGAVIPEASDYLASEVDNDSGVAGATVAAALDQLDTDIGAITAPVTSVFSRTGIVTADASDYDASQVDNDSSVAGATVATALDQLDSDMSANAADIAQRKKLELSGAGVPGVATGNGYPIGQLYIDTATSKTYVLTDATVDANVWTESGTTDHGLLGGLTDDDHTQYVLADGTRNQVEVLLDEETTKTGTPSSTQAIFWADDHANGQRLRWSRGRYPADYVIPFASSFSNTGLVYWSGVTGQQASSSLFTYSGGRLWLNTAGGSLRIKEAAALGSAPSAGNGAFWVRNDTPNVPMFTDDGLTANRLAYDSEKKDNEMSGAGAPGVSTGNGRVVGTIYVDTTGDDAYVLADATTDANVWALGPPGAGSGDTVTSVEYDSTTTAGSGGVGTIRFNNATVASATVLYVDDTDLNSMAWRDIWGQLQNGANIILRKQSDPTHSIRLNVVGATDNTTYCTLTTSTISTSSAWTNPTDGDILTVEFVGVTKTAGSNAISLDMEERSSPPAATTGQGKIWVNTDGANSAPPVQTLWHTNDINYDQRLGMNMITISGEVSPSVGSTWYSWGSAGPYNDTLWTDAVGTGTAPTTSNWFSRPPLAIIPGDAYIERVVGWYQSESASVGTWEMELVSVAVKDADTTVGSVDPIVDGSINAAFAVANSKITLLSHTVNDRTALPTDTSHMNCLYMAFQETTATPLNVDLRFGVTIYWSTFTEDGWVSDGFAAS